MKWKNMVSETPRIDPQDSISITCCGIGVTVYITDGFFVGTARAIFSFPANKGLHDLDHSQLSQNDADSCKFVGWSFSCEYKDLVSYEMHELERMYWEKEFSVDKHLISLDPALTPL